MNAELWQEVKAVLASVMHVPSEQRHAKLDAACRGRPELRREVVSLLGHGDEPPTPGPQLTAPQTREIQESLDAIEPRRFDILRQIGQGGFGAVYEARDRTLGTTVAVKRLTSHNSAALLHFKDGFRAIRELRHRNLARVDELLSDGVDWLLVMELVDGVHFNDYVGGPITSEAGYRRLTGGLAQLAEAIIALHDHDVLHRDIKPSNVLVSPDDRVRVLDFGLAKSMTIRHERPSATLAGTPDYMAPELLDANAVTPAIDWYSVGVMLYESLAGRRPFEGHYFDVMLQKRQSQPVPPSEVGAKPPGDLEQLCMALLRRDPQERPDGREVLHRLRRARGDLEVENVVDDERGSAPFVGRRRELEALARSFKEVEGGRAAVVEVRGASGVGKTSLVRKFLSDVRNRRSRTVILEGRCHPGESVPYKALDELIDGLARYLLTLSATETKAVLPRNAHLLHRLFPVLESVVPTGRAPAVDELDRVRLRRRSIHALRELLARIAEQHPLVLVIDDMQWHDQESREVLEALMSGDDPPELLLVLLYRDQDVGAPRLIEAKTSVVHRAVVDVTELSEADAEEMAAVLCAGEASGTIARESGGNPFFIHTLARYVGPSSSSSRDPIEIPTLQHLIRQRAERLTPQALELLQLVAVSGQPVSERSVRSMLASDAGWGDARGSLLTDFFLKSRRSGENAQLDVYHSQVRESIVEGMPAETLRGLNRRLATHLERDGGADPERLFGYFLAAGLDAKAGHYAGVAGGAAESALAFQRAADLYEKALALTPATDRRRTELNVALARTLALGGRGREAAEEYERAAKEASEHERFDLYLKAAEEFLKSGHVEEGDRRLRELCRASGLHFPRSSFSVILRAAIGRARVQLSRLDFVERPAASLPLSRKRRLDLCWSAGLGMSLVDPFRASYFHSRYLMDAIAAGDRRGFAIGLAGEVANSAIAGHKQRERIQHIEELASVALRDVADPVAQGFAKAMRGVKGWLLGDWRQAYEISEQAVKLFEKNSILGWERTTSQIIALSGLVMLGDWRRVHQQLDPLVEDARARGDRYASVGLRLMPYPHIIGLAQGRPDEAEAAIRAALDEWQEDAFHIQHCDAAFGLMEVAMYRGDAGQALAVMRKYWTPLTRSHLLRAQLTRIFFYVLRARARLMALQETGRKHVSKRRRLLNSVGRDVRKLSREPAPWCRGWVGLLQAGIDFERGSTEAGAIRLRDAAVALDQAHMPQYAAAALYWLDRVSGGTEADEVIRERTNAWLEAERLENPARLFATLAPGRWQSL